MKNLILLFLYLFSYHVASSQVSSGESEGNNQLSADVQLKTFELIWNRVNDEYYDSTFTGIDWKKVYHQYLPVVKKPMASDAFHRLLNEMLDEIKESHLSIAAPPKNSGDKHSNSMGNPGLELESVQNNIVITKIHTLMPAEDSKIKPGDVLISVDNTPVETIYKEFRKINPAIVSKAIAVTRKLNGVVGSAVVLKLKDKGNKTYSVTLNRVIDPSHGRPDPATYKKLNAQTGYIKVPSWQGKLPDTLTKALNAFADCKTVIIDLRGNNGGIASYIINFTNRLMKNKGTIGTFYGRRKKESFDFRGSESAFEGKVIVLIDEKSASSSEVFAAGLQEAGRATIIGIRSGGAVLRSNIEMLPTGGTLLYPTDDFFTTKGVRLEGRGVKPDITVTPTRKGIYMGRDEVLEKAISISER
jgi:carboxyl-terminal processing protease